MPDKWNFNHLGHEVRCIEAGCEDIGGMVGFWPAEKREQHFLTHYREPQTKVSGDVVYEIQGEIRIQDCIECGNPFEQKRKRGRPQLKCEECRNA